MVEAGNGRGLGVSLQRAVRLTGVGGLLLAAFAVCGAQGIPVPSQGVPAASQGSNGARAGQGVTSPSTPGAVPQASTVQIPGSARPSRQSIDDLKGLSPTGLKTSIWQMKGMAVDRVAFEGVTFGA